MNINQRNLITVLPLCAAVAAPGLSFGALIDRGGLIYDTDLNITWLADAYYARRSYSWSEAVNWAANLSYYDSGRNVTFDDWRLPTTLQPDPSCSYQAAGADVSSMQSYGYECSGSEMGHLFYSALGGVAGRPIGYVHDADYELFHNIQNSVYWSATELAPDSRDAWSFDFSSGAQYPANRLGTYWVLVVSDGDIAAAFSAVPIPSAAWMFGSGLLGLVGFAKRKRVA